MSKSHSFSIYLLKEDFDARNALKADHTLDDAVAGEALPDGSTLFVLDNAPIPPWWKAYFGIQKDLRQALKGAVVFLPVDGRVFAITFGHVYHNLVDTSYEYDFGLRVTLNCLDPDKLKSTDILEPSGARRQRTQMPTDSDLTYFDFDQDTTILKSLTGKVKDEHKSLFKHATGASNIRVSSDVTPGGLTELCEKLLNLYEDDTYKTTFPGLQNISPVRDPSILAALDGLLVEAVKAKSDSLSLSVPEILNYHEGLWATFSGAGAGLIYDDVFIGRYYEYLNQRQVSLDTIDVETLRKHCLNLTNEEGQPRGERHSVYKCLIFDTALGESGATYHLCDGNWYLVDSDFVTGLSTFLDPFCAESTFPDFTHENEAAFNEAIAATGTGLICLDMTSIAPDGQKGVEPCDVYELKDGKAVLHHVKISTLSAQLSHLFNQGTNSVHLLRDDADARDKLKSLVSAKAPANAQDQFASPIDGDRFKVVFQIVTHKNAEAKALNLPLFSRISLMRALKDLRRMGIEAEFAFIKDATPTSAGKKKKRQSKGDDQAANNDNQGAEAA